MHEPGSGWIVAVDGGGSKIAIAAIEQTPSSAAAKPESLDAVRTWTFAGTGSAHPATWSSAAANITSAVASVITELKTEPNFALVRIHLALAGAGRIEDQQRVVAYVTESLADLVDTDQLVITCCGDIDPLLDYWDNADSQSIALILGTGSIVASRSADGSMIRAGGWGPNLGDECSGAAIGNSALREIVRQLDSGVALDRLSPLALRLVALLANESAAEEPLTRPVLSTLLIQTAADRTRAARLSLLVVEVAYSPQDSDCAEAMRILQPHLEAICWQVLQVARRVTSTNARLRLVFGGGLAERSAALRQAIESVCQAQGLTIVESTFANPLLAVLRSAT